MTWTGTQRRMLRQWAGCGGTVRRGTATSTLVTTGTIEEKIYQRQVMKSGLAVGEGDLSVGQFTREELRDLFTFQPNIGCDTHNLLQCNCEGVGDVIKEGEEELVEERKCQLGRTTSASTRKGMGKKQAETAGWQHFKG